MIALYSSLSKSRFYIRKSMQVVFLLTVIVVSSLPVFAYSAEIVDRIIAVVNDELITYTMLNKAFKPYEKRIKAQNYSFTKEMEIRFEFRERVINQMIDEKITEQEVKRLGIRVSSSEVETAIERTKSINSITDEKLRQMLKKDGLTMENYRKNIRSELLRTRLIQYEVKSKIIVTDGEIESHYKANKEDYEEKTLDEATPEIREKLYRAQVERKFTKWIAALREKAHIKIIQ